MQLENTEISTSPPPLYIICCHSKVGTRFNSYGGDIGRRIPRAQTEIKIGCDIGDQVKAFGSAPRVSVRLCAALSILNAAGMVSIANESA
eukprot:IDg7738t1